MCPLSEYLKQMNSILPDHGEISVAALEEGFSNKTYVIRWQNRSHLVVRIPQLDESVFQIHRATELKVWQFAEQAGIAAPLRWHNDHGVVACDFLTAQTLPWNVLHDRASLVSICQAIKTLHQLPALEHSYNIYSLLKQWLEFLGQQSLTPAVAQKYHQVACWFSDLPRVERPQELRVCHNDLNPKNMLQDQAQTWLIDWECAGMNDPLFDLAVLSHCHHLSPTQVEDVHESLFGRSICEYRRTALLHYRQAYVLRELIWLLLKHVLHGTQDLDCLQWYHALLSDPMFNPYFKTE